MAGGLTFAFSAVLCFLCFKCRCYLFGEATIQITITKGELLVLFYQDMETKSRDIFVVFTSLYEERKKNPECMPICVMCG